MLRKHFLNAAVIWKLQTFVTHQNETTIYHNENLLIKAGQ